MKYIRADLDNYLQTSNLINRGFEKAVRIARKRLGSGGILGIVDVHERRFDKFREFTVKSVMESTLPRVFYSEDIFPGQHGFSYKDLGRGILHFKEEGVTVIRGVRTFTTDDKMSFIAYGLPDGEYIKRRGNLGEMLQEAREKEAINILHQGGALVEYMTRQQHNLDYVDGVIVHSGSAHSQSRNELMQRFYENLRSQHDIGSVITSGGHSYSEIGTSWMEISEPKNYVNTNTFIEELREAIKHHGFSETNEQRTRNTVMPIVHGLKLKFWWIEKSKTREIIDGIAK